MRIWGFGLRSIKFPVIPVFLAGLALGIFIMFAGRGVFLEEAGLFDRETLYHMKYMTVDGNALFSYVLRKRIFGFLILAVLSTTYLGMAVCVGAAAWYGMSAGAFFAALLIRYGVRGIILALAAVFPQYLVYVPVLTALLGWCQGLYRGIYRRAVDFEKDRGYAWRKLGQLAGILAAGAAGCALEAYVNPYVLLGYLKVF